MLLFICSPLRPRPPAPAHARPARGTAARRAAHYAGPRRPRARAHARLLLAALRSQDLLRAHQSTMGGGGRKGAPVGPGAVVAILEELRSKDMSEDRKEYMVAVSPNLNIN